MNTLTLGNVVVPASSLNWKFHLSSGPGGQNAAKVSTAAELRFSLEEAQLEANIASRLREIAGNRINSQDELVINARAHRTQERNRRDAMQRLTKLLEQAQLQPKVRKPTRPTRASKRARLDLKRRISEKKRNRRYATSDAD
ncbi:MAG: alternative ribosome rescue aminoacyl-tRNA hydrolase ArfB [Gammaproteobacteria bacterium]|nr:alternative ribosome rescue aminoacyl-tRNA hydrolase ArfB [Gammaproteobacteria bacterium]